jgi:hypothetical protein
MFTKKQDERIDQFVFNYNRQQVVTSIKECMAKYEQALQSRRKQSGTRSLEDTVRSSSATLSEQILSARGDNKLLLKHATYQEVFQSTQPLDSSLIVEMACFDTANYFKKKLFLASQQTEVNSIRSGREC